MPAYAFNFFVDSNRCYGTQKGKGSRGAALNLSPLNSPVKVLTSGLPIRSQSDYAALLFPTVRRERKFCPSSLVIKPALVSSFIEDSKVTIPCERPVCMAEAIW